jgi:uncharacterized protein YutE (UPF0331/DUF86 family)
VGDKIMRRFVERTLQLAVECCLDVGMHVISSEGFREPDNNRDVFQVLVETSVITPELGQCLKEAAGFRNVLVHEYTRVDPTLVHQVLVSQVGDLRMFGSTIKERFSETE